MKMLTFHLHVVFSYSNALSYYKNEEKGLWGINQAIVDLIGLKTWVIWEEDF